MIKNRKITSTCLSKNSDKKEEENFNLRLLLGGRVIFLPTMSSQFVLKLQILLKFSLLPSTGNNVGLNLVTTLTDVMTNRDHTSVTYVAFVA